MLIQLWPTPGIGLPIQDGQQLTKGQHTSRVPSTTEQQFLSKVSQAVTFD